MRILLMSMPDVIPIIIHETALHMPNLGIATVGANLPSHHQVYIADLVRKRRDVTGYLHKILIKIQPDVVGLSAMAWQYATCTRLMKLIKSILPRVSIVIGGYHATLMYDEISESPESAYIDFMVRGEGEIVFARLLNALEGIEAFENIGSLSYKRNGRFVHNDRTENIDLSTLKPPIRDHRRLTGGYHMLFSKIEVMETSRGCTRACNFCSMKHMYGRTFRAFPVHRILKDLDDIYYRRKTRMVFIADDNFVLRPGHAIQVSEAITRRGYRNLRLIVQADCVTMAASENMVRKMGEAGFSTIFLGIENVSDKNLGVINKGRIVEASRQAVKLCHKYGMMVIAGMVFGFPDDDEHDIIRNYEFLKDVGADAAYCQILTPYLKTKLREKLLEAGLVTNEHDYSYYNGIFANVKTRYLDSRQLQYLFWLHRQKVIGWWDPSDYVKRHNRSWVKTWQHIVKPMMKFFVDRRTEKYGWYKRYERELARWKSLNEYRGLSD